MYNNINNMVFLSLIVRCFNEPFLDEFVDYYFAEGVNIIYILFDTKSTIPISDKVKNNPLVMIIPSETNDTIHENLWKNTNILYSKIRHTSEWFMYIDCDEFITTRKHSQLTICDELKTTFKDTDCIKIPWIMMSCNKRDKDPPNILQHIVHRWNHDKKHPHPTNWFKGRCRYNTIQVKCIFKSKIFNHITDHCPSIPSNGGSFRCVDGVYNRPYALNSSYANLREHDINNALLICHHYRVISRDSCKRKYLNSGFSAYQGDWKNLWLCDYSEVIDKTLLIKSRNRQKLLENTITPKKNNINDTLSI